MQSAFGTGGMRGRTIGTITTKAEKVIAARETPQYAAVGSNTLNEITVLRATQLFFLCQAVDGRTGNI